MTELDAHLIAAVDISDASSRLQEARDPQQLISIYHQFVAHRLDGLCPGMGRAAHVLTQPSGGETLSASIVATTLQLLLQLKKRMKVPEDLRAFLIWLVGIDDDPGFAPIVLGQAPDRDTEGAVARLLEQVAALRVELDQAHALLLERAHRELTSAEMQAVRSLLVDARMSTADQDGQTARASSVRARKLIRTLLDRRQSSRVLGFDR